MSENATYGSGLYAHHKIGDVEQLKPGYVKAWLAPVSHVTTFIYPVQGGTPALGELFKTASAHTFTSGKGAIEVYVHRDSVEASMKTVGETQALIPIWAPKIVIIGDGAKIQEIVNNVMNDAMVLFLQPDCNVATYEQYGNDKDPLYFKSIGFASGNYGGGKRAWEMEGETRTRQFHTATLDVSIT
jgi:hypothetical protein